MKNNFIVDVMLPEEYKKEHIAWLKKLEMLQLETVNLKNRVAEIVQKEMDADTLEHVEYFQNSFLNKDTIIALLRGDIKQQSIAVTNIKAMDSGAIIDQINTKQDNLRKDISSLEKELNRLKIEFDDYFQKVL